MYLHMYMFMPTIWASEALSHDAVGSIAIQRATSSNSETHETAMEAMYDLKKGIKRNTSIIIH